MNELQTVEPEVAGQRALFDYAALDQETQVVVRLRASEIKGLAKRMASDVVDIGGKLAEVKDRIGGNGKFNDWLSAELGWSERTAYNFMAVWQRFSAANFALENVATSALYLLAAPSTPAEAVEVARQIAGGGQKVTHEVAKEIVRQAKARKPKQVELIEGPEESEEPQDSAPVQTCRVCGCTETDCRRCVEKTGAPCYWVEEDLCSACVAEPEKKQAPAELPLGWGFDGRLEGFCAIDVARNLRTLVFPTREEAISAAHLIEMSKQDGLLGLTGRGLVSQGVAPQERIAAPAPAGQRPAAWYKSRIEISITLMPGGDAQTRKIMHSVRAGDAPGDIPFVGVSSGEAELLEVLPPITRGLFEKAAEAFVKKQAAKPAAKSTAKSKPAAKKPAAKSTKKGGKK